MSHKHAIPLSLLFFLGNCLPSKAAYTDQQKASFLHEVYAKTTPAQKKTWSKVIAEPIPEFLANKGIHLCDAIKGAISLEKHQEIRQTMNRQFHEKDSEYELFNSTDEVIEAAALKHLCPDYKSRLNDDLEKQIASGGLSREEARILGKTPTPIKSSASSASAGVNVVLNGDLRYEGNYVIGSVTNIGSKNARYVKVNFAIYNDYGALVDTGSAYTQPTDLAPGQTGFFKGVSLQRGATVRTTSIEWSKILSQ